MPRILSDLMKARKN